MSVTYSSSVQRSFTRYGSETVTCTFQLDTVYDPQTNTGTLSLHTGVSNALGEQYSWYGDVKANGSIVLSYVGDWLSGVTSKSWNPSVTYDLEGNPSVSSYSISWNGGGSYSTSMGNTFGYYDDRSWVKSAEGFSAPGAGSGTVYVYKPTFYSLTIDKSNGDAPSSESHAAGYVMQLPTPMRAGYTFDGWTLTGSGTVSADNSTFTFGSGNATLIANWVAIPYTVSITQGTGSTVTVTKNGTPVSDGDTVTYGDALLISFAAETGYDLTTSTVNGITWTSAQLIVTGAVTIIAAAKAKEYSLSLTVSDSGLAYNVLRTSSPFGGGAIGGLADGATIYYGDVIKVNFTVSSGYQIQTATVNGTDISDAGEINVTVSQNMVVVLTVKLGALVYIGNEPYQAFIWNGSSWEQYEAYIGNGNSWEAY